MRLVFLIEYPFSERDYRRFGIEPLEQDGFQVEVWDFTPFLHPEVHQTIRVPDPIDYSGYRPFSRGREARRAIAELDQSSFAVCMIGYGFESLPVFRALSKARLRYFMARTNALPHISLAVKPKSLGAKIVHATPAKLWKMVFRHVPPGYLGIRPAPYVLAGGAASVGSAPPIEEETRILWAHALDYDLYLAERERSVEVDEKMGVFLDECMPDHPDYVQMGIPPPCGPEHYYPRLCFFFDMLERLYKVHVVVAAHPRSHHGDHPSYFGGRPVLQGQTAGLVRKSGFVLAHASTSLNFAVLFKKPVMIITTDKIQQHLLAGPMVSAMASSLGKNPINLDTTLHFDWQKEKAIDEAAYARYKEAYIKKDGSPEKPCWRILADCLKELGAPPPGRTD